MKRRTDHLTCALSTLAKILFLGVLLAHAGCGDDDGGGGPGPDGSLADCTDGVKNGTESDVDCGSDCEPCESGRTCRVPSDCASGACSESGLCVDATCDDGVENGEETGVDCGGPDCESCLSEAECDADDDCASGVCDTTAGMCVDPSCDDGVRNGGETEVDCGGECPACEPDSSCDDEQLNGDETDVDCGGGDCPPCGSGLSCGEGTDCESGVCGADDACADPSCDDGVHNGNETDVDCGGDECSTCDTGEGCEGDDDCASGVCDEDAEMCVGPQCDDQLQNGDESDVDCGGDECAGCDTSEMCAADDDCESGVCFEETPDDCDSGVCSQDDCDSGVCGAANTCAAPSCSDLVVNGAEECDEGAIDTASCNYDCTLVECGDEYINSTADEQCDDGDDDGADGCSDVCAVEPGWTCAGSPSVCTQCPSGTYGAANVCTDCGVIANCSVTETCDATDGSDLICPTCAPGYVGDGLGTCTACEAGTYDDADTCSDCGMIANCAATETCDATDGSDVVCPTCAPGYYGSGTGACAPCTAIPSCVGAVTCSTIADQVCAECAPGYIGDGTGACTACAAGTYDTANTCVDCGTITNCGGVETCDVLDGSDLICGACAAGYIGDGTGTCTACAAGTYEDDNTCSDCPAIANCAAVETCDFTDGSDGVCPTCAAGYIGDGTGACTACAAGTYDNGNTCSDCGTIANCAFETCDVLDGSDVVCGTCSPGYSGDGTATCAFAPYAFTTHTFTSCGASGPSGPTLSSCRMSYGTAWDDIAAYFDMTTQGYQLWTVPSSGTYRIEVYGAQGGSDGGSTGGLGARVRGDFALTQGAILKIVVGQMGTASGGGGGSFVTQTSNVPLIIAGGGSGTGTGNGGGGRIDFGVGGGGGAADSTGCGASGGGGLNASGGSAGTSAGGASFVTTALGGAAAACDSGVHAGGFGGGGGGGHLDNAGGGGGYIGGFGKWVGIGQGGDSYNAGINQSNSAAAHTGHGQVVITKL